MAIIATDSWWQAALVAGLARLDGHPVGVLGADPRIAGGMRHLHDLVEDLTRLQLLDDLAELVQQIRVPHRPDWGLVGQGQAEVLELNADPTARAQGIVVESKKEFATRYAVDAEYWQRFDIEDSPEVVGFLKMNLTDLANHYHALYQEPVFVDERPQNFAEASRWYRQFLYSFPSDGETPQVNYQLADLLLENENFGEAALEYERTAYEYEAHEQSSAAGYAAIYAHREDLKIATGARTLDVKKATVDSSLRFADAFPEHEQAPVVLGAAADDLYEMKDFVVAIDSAQKLIDRYPDADSDLLRSAWAVVAHSSIDLAEYANAENAYKNVLALTPAEDESRPAVIDGLAASIYKQGEQANLLEDYRTAANHFLRIKELAPTSDIRSIAEYDAAAALMKLEDWAMASSVLEEFRSTHPEHELNAEATKQLAHIYREDGQTERSAAEHERIAAEATDPELAREALLTAAELYDEVNVLDDAVRVYEQYVTEYPYPLDFAMEARNRLSEIFKAESDYERYYAQLNDIIDADREAGVDRSTIGHISWVAILYAFKFAWAPLVDRLPVPLLSRQLGQRRAWMLVAQCGVVAGLLAIVLLYGAANQLLSNFAAIGTWRNRHD